MVKEKPQKKTTKSTSTLPTKSCRTPFEATGEWTLGTREDVLCTTRAVLIGGRCEPMAATDTLVTRGMAGSWDGIGVEWGGAGGDGIGRLGIDGGGADEDGGGTTTRALASAIRSSTVFM